MRGARTGGAARGRAFWLLAQDIALRTARGRGLSGYVGRCLLSGYVWLGVGAVVLAAPGAAYASLAWDAGLHAIFLGFVFSMVFGHAPLVVPAIARAELRFHGGFYVPLALLHLSVAARLAGALADIASVRNAGGLLSTGAIALFVATLLWTIVRRR